MIRNIKGETPLILAIKVDCKLILELLLAKYKDIVNEENPENKQFCKDNMDRINK